MGIICASGGQCLNAGYLTVEKVVDPLLGKYILRIPNKEIVSEFSSLNRYEIISNREQGEGRFDICLKNRNAEDPSIIIELKYTKDVSKDLQDLAHQACIQITEKQYGYPMQKVIKIGLAHCGKQARMYVQRD